MEFETSPRRTLGALEGVDGNVNYLDLYQWTDLCHLSNQLVVG